MSNQSVTSDELAIALENLRRTRARYDQARTVAFLRIYQEAPRTPQYRAKLQITADRVVRQRLAAYEKARNTLTVMAFIINNKLETAISGLSIQQHNYGRSADE